MSQLGFDPRTVDTMEVWEAASILRRYEDTGDDADGAGTSTGPRPGERDLIAERMAHAAGTGPKPEPDPPRPDPPGVSSLDRVNTGHSVSD